jgi:phosphatidylserine decarboxylase
MMPIHKEGHKFLIVYLLIAGVVAVGLNILPSVPYLLKLSLNLGLLLLTLLFFWFFRIPKRPFGSDPLAVYAPVDGKVVVIEKVHEPEYFNDPRIQVSIFMSPFNPHVNFTPMEAEVEYFKYHPGNYLLAFHPKSSDLNEHTSIGLRGKHGTLLMKQIAGAVARRIVWYCEPGEHFKTGSEIGFIKFGSRIDLLLPVDAEILVQMGQRVRAGSDVIARFQA